MIRIADQLQLRSQRLEAPPHVRRTEARTSHVIGRRVEGESERLHRDGPELARRVEEAHAARELRLQEIRPRLDRPATLLQETFLVVRDEGAAPAVGCSEDLAAGVREAGGWVAAAELTPPSIHLRIHGFMKHRSMQKRQTFLVQLACGDEQYRSGLNYKTQKSEIMQHLDRSIFDRRRRTAPHHRVPSAPGMGARRPSRTAVPTHWSPSATRSAWATGRVILCRELACIKVMLFVLWVFQEGV